MEFLRTARKVGNSSGIILPKKLLGSEVKIIVVKMQLDIKKNSIELLKEYFPDLLGIYITDKEPAEVLAISSSIKKIIKTEKIKLSIVPLSLIKKDIKSKLRLRRKLIKAEIIFNKNLLNELKKEILAL